MPIYQYRCETCDKNWKEMHGADDKGGLCEACGLYCKRSLPSGQTVLTQAGITDAGRRVEKFIEEGREAFKEQLAESRKDYTP